MKRTYVKYPSSALILGVAAWRFNTLGPGKGKIAPCLRARRGDNDALQPIVAIGRRAFGGSQLRPDQPTASPHRRQDQS